MNLRRVIIVKGDNLGVYVHGARIGVITQLEGGSAELAKDLAMHVAANSPQFVRPEDVSPEVVAKEREIQIDIAINSGKPKEIAEKMVEGRMSKFTGEVSLTGQMFVKDPSISVADLLKKDNANVINFTRFEVGEGIEKQDTDFAAEVASIVAASK
jgi:elongation factor Ts